MLYVEDLWIGIDKKEDLSQVFSEIKEKHEYKLEGGSLKRKKCKVISTVCGVYEAHFILGGKIHYKKVIHYINI